MKMRAHKQWRQQIAWTGPIWLRWATQFTKDMVKLKEIGVGRIPFGRIVRRETFAPSITVYADEVLEIERDTQGSPISFTIRKVSSHE